MAESIQKALELKDSDFREANKQQAPAKSLDRSESPSGTQAKKPQGLTEKAAANTSHSPKLEAESHHHPNKPDLHGQSHERAIQKHLEVIEESDSDSKKKSP